MRRYTHTVLLKNAHGITFDDLITAPQESRRCQEYVNRLGNYKECTCYDKVKKKEDKSRKKEGVATSVKKIDRYA
jgi:hypothetical protein